MRLLVVLVDYFLFVPFFILVIALALADSSTCTPGSTDIFLGCPFELIELAIQLGECPLRRCPFVEHGLDLEGRGLELPEDHIVGITDALESCLQQETGENRLGLGVDIAIALDKVGGLR